MRKAKHNLSEEEIKPYFTAENVLKGVFLLANKLYGVTFEKRPDIPVYHPDVAAWEVKDKDGSHIGIFYTDYYVRDSKRGGAWMSSFRKQSVKNGESISPIIYNVCNFPPPTDGKPSLLNIDQIETAFHEFGHATHGLFSKCTYETLSGTAVPRDFVELPSQINENWALEPELLKEYAFNYKTGEVIPDELIQKINNSALFNQGFATTEFVAAALLDMDFSTLKNPIEVSVTEFEKKVLKDKYNLMDEIAPRYRPTYFQHIFAGGYSAGYYSYLWAEVLDADAFEAFKETGLFNPETAASFRENVLSKGGTDDAMMLYERFRGKAPDITPLLKRKGFVK